MTNEIVVNKNTNSKQLKRLILACTLLVSTLLCIFVSGQIQANYDKFNIVLDDLDSSDGDHSNEANVLPAKFEEELFCVDKLMAADIKVSDTKNVIGFVCATNSNFLAESIKSQMQSNG